MSETSSQYSSLPCDLGSLSCAFVTVINMLWNCSHNSTEEESVRLVAYLTPELLLMQLLIFLCISV